MYKIFIYKSGEFKLVFPHISFNDLTMLQTFIEAWYRHEKNDKTTEFIICDENRIIKTLNYSHFE